jgi:hypothetical protein
MIITKAPTKLEIHPVSAEVLGLRDGWPKRVVTHSSISPCKQKMKSRKSKMTQAGITEVSPRPVEGSDGDTGAQADDADDEEVD